MKIHSLVRAHAASVMTLALAALATGCKEDLPSGPTRFDSQLGLHNWSDTLVLGERRRVSVRVLDDAQHEVLARTVGWTVGDSAVLSVALAPGASAGGGTSATVASTDSVELHGLKAGASTLGFQFQDPSFTGASVSKTVHVVAGGVRLVTEWNGTMNAIGDTAVVVATAVGLDTDGVSLVPFTGQGLTWSTVGSGAVTLVGTGDTVRVVAEHEGEDTILVTHPDCRAGAQCVDGVIVTVRSTPTGGADVVVFDDIDMWSDYYGADPSNQKLFENLVGFTNTKSRATGRTVMLFNGASSRCLSFCWSYTTSLEGKMTALDYTIVRESSSLANIPSDVKVVFLFLPMAALPKSDINGLKQFASEGGRVVLVGENAFFYGGGFAAENQILADLGSSLTNQGGCFVGNLEDRATAEGAYQVVAGISSVHMGCSSAMTPGPNDVVLFRAPTGEVVGAVSNIDLTPLP